MRKVYIETRIRVTVHVDEGVRIGDVMDTLSASVNCSGVTLDNTEILDWRIIDSK
jgi:hypothetical protein